MRSAVDSGSAEIHPPLEVVFVSFECDLDRAGCCDIEAIDHDPITGSGAVASRCLSAGWHVGRSQRKLASLCRRVRPVPASSESV